MDRKLQVRLIRLRGRTLRSYLRNVGSSPIISRPKRKLVGKTYLDVIGIKKIEYVVE